MEMQPTFSTEQLRHTILALESAEKYMIRILVMFAGTKLEELNL
jgi:hypothetical protein